MGKIMVESGKKFCYHIGIVCVTCRNLLKMGIRTGAMKSSSRTLFVISIIFQGERNEGHMILNLCGIQCPDS